MAWWLPKATRLVRGGAGAQPSRSGSGEVCLPCQGLSPVLPPREFQPLQGSHMSVCSLFCPQGPALGLVRSRCFLNISWKDGGRETGGSEHWRAGALASELPASRASRPPYWNFVSFPKGLSQPV